MLCSGKLYVLLIVFHLILHYNIFVFFSKISKIKQRSIPWNQNNIVLHSTPKHKYKFFHTLSVGVLIITYYDSYGIYRIFYYVVKKSFPDAYGAMCWNQKSLISCDDATNSSPGF